MKAYNLSKKNRLYHKAVKKAEEQQNQGFYESAALAWLEAAILLPQDKSPEAIVSCLDKARLATNSNDSYLKAELALVLNNLGNVYYEKGELDKAEFYFQQSLGINERNLNKEHPEIVDVLKNLGHIYYEKGELYKAESHFQRALVISEKTLNKKDYNIASILNNLGCIYYEKGELDKSELYFQYALIIRKKLLGKDTNNTDKTSDNLIDYIKEINRLTQENIQIRTALFQANRLAYLGKIVAMTAHNMNYPVDTIQTTTLTALHNAHNENIELQPLLKDIFAQTERLNSIISNFKDFVSGDRTIMIEINLNNIIDDIYKLLFDAPFRFDNIQLIKNFIEPSPIAYANEFSLQEILITVLSSVREILKNKPIKTVRISTWQEDDKVGFTIEESIDGVDEEPPLKSFTPLLASKNENVGLGLYFCKAICSSLGGDISHYPILKGGTAFHISLMSDKK